MDERGRQLLEAALTLPEDERASIAAALIDSLPHELEEQDDEELAAELDRRLEEAVRDPSCTTSWSDVKARG
jgi:putative addiction module component (TIGR02574 family)